MNVNCATWASIGECESNPSFMRSSCPVTCRLCQSEDCRDEREDCAALARGGPESNFSSTTGCYSNPELLQTCAWTCLSCNLKSVKPCKRDPGVKPSAWPGSTNAMFEAIAAHPSATVHSREPWVITLDNFLSGEEADAVLAAGSGAGTGWARSQAGDGVQAALTSSTSWCRKKCLEDATVQRVQRRVEALTSVPIEYAEYMQVLEYQQGQFYKVHHDQNSPRSSAWGPRLYTFFMYLAEGYTGGETHFPRLNITVAAAKGRALVWTSVLDSDPYERDDRTDHEALPVETGTKYAANYWLHMYPFRTKSDFGCGNVAYIDNWY